MSENQLLPDEHVLVVQPALAVAVGLNEAVALEQIHYWLLKRLNVVEGHAWVYNTYDKWQEQWPFWSYSTVRRTLEKLEKKGLLITANYNRLGIDQTKWYRIDYDALHRMVDSRRTVNPDSPVVKNDNSVAQNEQMESSYWADQFTSLGRPLPETTPKTTAETTTSLVGTYVPTAATPAELTPSDKEGIDFEAEAKRQEFNMLNRQATKLIHHFEVTTGKRVKRESGNVIGSQRTAARAIIRECGSLEAAIACADELIKEQVGLRNIVSLRKRLALKAKTDAGLLTRNQKTPEQLAETQIEVVDRIRSELGYDRRLRGSYVS